MRTHRPGAFTKGHKKLGGRQKGTRNRFNRDLIDAIVQAAEQVGSDGRGKKGVDGYLQMLAGKKAGYFVGLLRQAVQKQVPAAEQPENAVVYRSEQDLRQGLLDRGVHPSLLPPPARDPHEEPPPHISPPNPPPGWHWTLRRREETVEPDTDGRAAVDTGEEAEMSGDEPITESEIEKRCGTPQHPARGWKWEYDGNGYFYPVRTKSTE